MYNQKRAVFCIFMCLVILWMPRTYSESMACEDLVYLSLEGYIPIIVSSDFVQEDGRQYVDSRGKIDKTVYETIHPLLTNGDIVVDADVSSKRLVLLLENNYTLKRYLQVVTYSQSSNEYFITRSQWLPHESYLDTYHDGNDAVLLTIGYETEYYLSSCDIDDMLWIYITIKMDPYNKWNIVNITDGYEFYIQLKNGTFFLYSYAGDEMLDVLGQQYTCMLDEFDLPKLLSQVNHHVDIDFK